MPYFDDCGTVAPPTKQQVEALPTHELAKLMDMCQAELDRRGAVRPVRETNYK